MTIEPKIDRSPATGESKLTRYANDLIIGVARHWLAIFNTVWGIYLFTPFLAPILMQIGWTGAAGVIYAIYSMLCHQLPDHSYFLFGPTLIPQAPELIAGGMPITDSLLIERSFIGSPELGWKVALCQRDVAIYSGVLLAGLSYARLRRNVRPLPFKLFLLLALPIALDGGTQLFGLRESNWLLRTLTGALFGAAAVFLAYPYVQDAMQEVLETELLRRAGLRAPAAETGVGRPPDTHL
ncbi:MAG: DUF2085 domain-containing protein [Caldilinea sp.]|nr:DUF2085 domain-containing protein [Caldilinea sp.]MDW8441686.1 DUF2085 domain-containing protein [Caldilineaceae bacterium]